MANYYFRNTGSTAWSTATNWSTTDGGIGDGAVPTSADNVFFTSNSGSVVLGISRPCYNFNCTGYTGNLNLGTSQLSFSGASFILSSSMTISGTGLFSIGTTNNPTLTSNGLSGFYIICINGGTVTLTDNFNVSKFGFQGNGVVVNGFNINISTLLLITVGTGVGTTQINIVGVCGTSISARLKNPITIKSTSTFTVTGHFDINCILTSEIGATVITTGSTLLTSSTSTINTPSVNWNIVSVNISTFTITLNSTLNCSVLNILYTGAVTFVGTSGFNCGTFSSLVGGRSISLKNGITYTVTSNLNIVGTSTSRITLSSTSTGALFNLQTGALQDVRFCNATWIDSSGGSTIYTSVGTLLNTTNWNISGGSWFLIL